MAPLTAFALPLLHATAAGVDAKKTDGGQPARRSDEGEPCRIRKLPHQEKDSCEKYENSGTEALRLVTTASECCSGGRKDMSRNPVLSQRSVPAHPENTPAGEEDDGDGDEDVDQHPFSALFARTVLSWCSAHVDDVWTTVPGPGLSLSPKEATLVGRRTRPHGV